LCRVGVPRRGRRGSHARKLGLLARAVPSKLGRHQARRRSGRRASVSWMTPRERDFVAE